MLHEDGDSEACLRMSRSMSKHRVVVARSARFANDDSKSLHFFLCFSLCVLPLDLKFAECSSYPYGYRKASASGCTRDTELELLAVP